MTNNKVLTAAVLCLMLFGCSMNGTKGMWESRKSYKDEIKGFLIGEDGEKVAFIGNKYHYIIDDNSGIIKELLTWKHKSKLYASTSNFRVKIDNSIELEINIDTYFKDFSKEEVDFFQKMGFVEFQSSENSRDSENFRRFSKKITSNGKRYLPKPDINYDLINNLERKIPVYIKYNSYNQVIQKAAFTPIVIVGENAGIALGDGAVYLFYILPSVILYPTCVFYGEYACDHNPFELNWK